MVKARGKGRIGVLLVETLDLRCVSPVAVRVYSFQLYTFKGLMNYTSGIIHHVRNDGFVGGVLVLLEKPQTYMNLSGESCGPLAAYYKLPLNPVLVLHDLTWILWEWMAMGGSLVLCLDTAQWVQDGITMYDCASCKSQK